MSAPLRRPRISKQHVPYIIAVALVFVALIALQKLPAVFETRKITAAITAICPGATNIQMYSEEGNIRRYTFKSDTIYGAQWSMPDGKTLKWTKEVDTAMIGASKYSKTGVPDYADTDCAQY